MQARGGVKANVELQFIRPETPLDIQPSKEQQSDVSVF